jgi:23S rRNA pseudouridine2605 synthase
MADKDDKNRGPRRGGKPGFDRAKTFGRERAGDNTGERPEGSFKPRSAKPDQHRAPRPDSPRKWPAKDNARPAARPQPAEGADDQTSERIAKRLARAGIASRRDAEALIADGRIKVNGKVLTSPAFNVSASDRIELDGAEIPPVERTRLFLFHKPAGVVTTNRDPEGRRTVFDVLPKDLPRLITVGRLDINTEGLLLLTNDGGLARILELPATGWLRRYRVRVHGKVDAEALAGLKDGIAVDGVFYGSIEATFDREQGSNAWLTIGLREGKNREVKNILAALGLDVNRLIRISYGPFQLGELAEGAVQELKGRTLRDQLGERLIEEAGANFEAPIARPFSNKPVRGHDEPGAERPRIVRDGIQGKVGEGGLIKQRKRDRGDERASALSRLTTKHEGKSFGKGDRAKPFAGKPSGGKSFGGKPFGGKDGERTERAPARTSNVWMAPGARPTGKERDQAESPASRSRGEGRGEGQRGPRKFGGQKGAGAKPGAPGPGGKPHRGPGKGGGSADRRR